MTRESKYYGLHACMAIWKRRPKDIIMGSETSGVSDPLFALAPTRIQIPGSGEVESLNVSVATSLCLSEYYRQVTAKG
jgi:TrmH RNA methyltransferase